MNHYYRQCQPRKTRKSPLVITCAILAMLALYGWMDERDTDPQLSVVTYDCAPEMDMPIDVGRVQL